MDKQEHSELLRRIHERCTEAGDCLEWTLKLNSWGQAFIHYRGVRYSVRRFVYAMKHGPIPAGMIVVDTCDNPRCVEHLKAITLTERNHKVAAAGWYRSPLRRAKQALKARARSVLSDDAVATIRASSEPAKEVAEAYGVSKSYVYMLRRGEFRGPINTPFAGLMR